MKLVLEAKPQGADMDVDDTVDLDASNAISLVVLHTEPEGSKPVGGEKTVDSVAKFCKQITYNLHKRGKLIMPQLCKRGSFVPGVGRVVFFKPNLPHCFKLHQQKVDHQLVPVGGLGQVPQVPGLIPVKEGKITLYFLHLIIYVPIESLHVNNNAKSDCILNSKISLGGLIHYPCTLSVQNIRNTS
jgi:hypothetical protein